MKNKREMEDMSPMDPEILISRLKGISGCLFHLADTHGVYCNNSEYLMWLLRDILDDVIDTWEYTLEASEAKE